MSNIKLSANAPAEDNHDTTQIAIVLTKDDHNRTYSVSCFGGYVMSPPLQLVLAGILKTKEQCPWQLGSDYDRLSLDHHRCSLLDLLY